MNRQCAEPVYHGAAEVRIPYASWAQTADLIEVRSQADPGSDTALRRDR